MELVGQIGDVPFNITLEINLKSGEINGFFDWSFKDDEQPSMSYDWEGKTEFNMKDIYNKLILRDDIIKHKVLINYVDIQIDSLGCTSNVESVTITLNTKDKTVSIIYFFG